MNTMAAFAMGEASRGKDPMVFDWDKAARIIVESGFQDASAGLCGDWNHTGGQIFSDGRIIPKEDTYVYLGSTWAVPELEIEGDLQDCFIMKHDSPGWTAETYWPDSARKIVMEGRENAG